jgi:uncharacterized protein YoxC
MNMDDLSKLILVLAVSFAIVLISIGLYKILNSLSGSIEDFRKTIKNVSSLSDMVLEDYTNVREEVYSFKKWAEGFKSSFLDPLKQAGKIVSVVAPLVNRRKN